MTSTDRRRKNNLAEYVRQGHWALTRSNWLSRYAVGALRMGLCIALLLAGLLTTGGENRVHAQETPGDEPSLVLTSSGSAVRVQWDESAATSSAGYSDLRLDLQPHGGHLLPMQTFAVILPNGATPLLSTAQLVDVPWTGDVEQAPVLEPPVLNWEPITQGAPLREQPLPAQPLFLLRSGHARGEHVAIFAFSELYQNGAGELRRVVTMDLTLPGAALVTEAVTTWDSMIDDASDENGRLDLVQETPPANEISLRHSAKISVENQGIQNISASDLAEAGIANPSVDRLQVFLRGVEIPLHVLDNNKDGKLNGAEAVRFYAAAPGDRWNTRDFYWIVEGTSPGKRMGYRSVAPRNASLRDTGLTTGIWRDNRLYESMLSGPDDDNWFHAELANPDIEAAESSKSRMTAGLEMSLPLATNSSIKSTFVVGGSAVDAREDRTGSAQVPHRLQLSGGTVTHTDGASDWIVDFGYHSTQDFERTISTVGTTSELTVRLLSGPYNTRIYVDQIVWQQPVRLDFAGKGAAFTGVEGQWRYRLANVPTNALLYDVTNPLQPTALGRTQDREYLFEDGPVAHSYLLAAEGTVYHPQLATHVPISVSDLDRAHVVYIAPKDFHAALGPLVAHRRNSGLIVETVAVQELYDGWGYGFVDPDAIRDFLRHAVGAWKTPPIAAVLVGDGTHDPKGYLGFDNPNHIPPYLADVDPWIGVTPCENCYAQLDGDDPLAESAFLTDILIGRLPVSTVAELESVVDKILRYEQASNPVAPWRNVSVQLADDWIHEGGWKDGAGNFTEFIERIAELRPPGIRYARLYYNPEIDTHLLDQATRDWMMRIEQWIESDRDGARSRALSLLNGGAGLVTFTGHANHWVWARLGEIAGYDHRLFGLWDVSALTNRDELFIGLSMTCLSAQFSEPAEHPMTIDEHLVLHPGGGAVAIWGPAGLSVAYGHDALQTGFYGKLWSESTVPGNTRIGSLVRAGYEYVALQTACCQDVTRTFLLLGDPMTPARVQPLDIAFMPAFSATSQERLLFLPSMR